MAVTVVARPEIVCAGIKMSTDFENVMRDCPALWKKFEPSMQAFPAHTAFAGESFGISVMTGETTLDYWAAMPLAPGAAVPDGMERVVLPAGNYAESDPVTLQDLGKAYDLLYTEWPKTQEKFAPDMRGLCYEKYTEDFMKSGVLRIYCPLRKCS